MPNAQTPIVQLTRIGFMVIQTSFLSSSLTYIRNSLYINQKSHDTNVKMQPRDQELQWFFIPITFSSYYLLAKWNTIRKNWIRNEISLEKVKFEDEWNVDYILTLCMILIPRQTSSGDSAVSNYYFNNAQIVDILFTSAYNNNSEYFS